MTHCTLLCWILLPLSGAVIAQNKNLAEKQQIVNTIGNEATSGSVQTFNERYEGTKGSPFWSDEWTDGEVRMDNGKVFDHLRIKYDLYQDEITVKRRDGAEVIPDKNTVASFRLDATQSEDARRFVRVDYLKNYQKFPHNHFAEVLYEGEATLLVVRQKKLIRADYRGAYHANRPYDTFGKVMTQYYWIDPKGRAHELKSNRKSVVRLFRDKKQLVSTFMEENTIDLDNAHDLVQLVQYYDQL